MAVNKIKAHAINTLLFMCNENDEVFERLLLHPEIRWLSKEKCLNLLFDIVVEFLQICDSGLAIKSCSSEMILHTCRTYSPNLMN